jgi:hypothetical protein
LLVTFALADIKFSRTISGVKSGYSGSATLDSGCSGKDTYGSNNCDLKWGETHTVEGAGVLPEDLNSKAKVSVDLKVDHIFPWQFDCNLCGSPCTVTIPVVKKTVTIKVPPCPIAKGSLTIPSTKFVLPAKSPVPVGIAAEGTATVYDDAGSTVAVIDANADVGPDKDSVHPLPDYETGVKALPEMITALITSMGFNVTDVTVEDQPFWSQFMGGKQAGGAPPAGGKQAGAFDYSKFMGGKQAGGAPPAGAGAFDYSKFMGGKKP